MPIDNYAVSTPDFIMGSFDQIEHFFAIVSFHLLKFNIDRRYACYHHVAALPAVTPVPAVVPIQ